MTGNQAMTPPDLDARVQEIITLHEGRAILHRIYETPDRTSQETLDVVRELVAALAAERARADQAERETFTPRQLSQVVTSSGYWLPPHVIDALASLVNGSKKVVPHGEDCGTDSAGFDLPGYPNHECNCWKRHIANGRQAGQQAK